MRLNFIASGGGIALFRCAQIVKSASGGVNLKFKHAAPQAALARERYKSAGAKFKRGGAASGVSICFLVRDDGSPRD
nr:hypothetical protein [uncultured Campylobacter sp.]